VALLIGLCLGLVCCELLVNTSHLDADYGEGGAEGGEEAGRDGRPGHDARHPGDAKPTRDASPGDGPQVDVDAGPFCASQIDAKFCADFDDGSVTYAEPMPWGKPDLVNATMSLDTHERRSPPASLEVILFPTEAGIQKSVAKLSTVFSQTVSRFRVAFDMRLDVIDMVTQSALEPFDVSFGSSTDNFTLTLELAPNGGLSDSGAGIYYQRQVDGGEAPGSGVIAFTRAPQAGEWTHIDISFTLNETTGTLNASLNDASVLENATFATGGSMQDPDIELGGTVFAPTRGWTVHFDNFVVWFE
jgi:hypothetical protein